VWDKWLQRLPLLYNPGPNVTVDEQLMPFRGRCPFRQYISSKPVKYGIMIWAACDAISSYAWNLQVYTGKPDGGAPEKNQGMRVVLDMTQGLCGVRSVVQPLLQRHREPWCPVTVVTRVVGGRLWPLTIVVIHTFIPLLPGPRI